MATLKHEHSINEEEIYFNFINSIKSEVTKKTYERSINLFMQFCGVNRLSQLLSISDPQKLIIKYLMSLRERGLSFNSISTELNGIYHLYDMNDIVLNRKKINMLKGDFTRKMVDRAYTREEIRRILDVSDLRIKVIILLMASCGMRIGALPSLRLRNLEKINNIYKITVYEGTNQEYFTFCTPECTPFIDYYFEYRKTNGEILHKDSFLIRDQFDITDIEQIRNRSKGIALNTLRVLIRNILLKSGLITVKHTDIHTRNEVARSHGFRKFFTTQLVNSKVNPEIREMLLGHKIGLASCYYKPTQEEMYNEYLKAVNLLTINEENRLKLKLEQKVQIERSQIESLKADFEKFKQEVLKQRKG
jgi:integrase